MDDGRIPKDILYGELATGTRPTGRPNLRFKDVCKRDLKAGNINLAGWEALAADGSHWRLARNSSAITATKPADLESDCTATAGAATQPLTKTWR